MYFFFSFQFLPRVYGKNFIISEWEGFVPDDDYHLIFYSSKLLHIIFWHEVH